MMWSVALRNLYRDRRRTITSAIAVGAGLLAALLFLAYVLFIESSLASVVIYSDTNGHVQVYRKDGPQNLAAYPSRFSLTSEDQVLVSASAKSLDGFKRSSQQIVGVGVVQHGNQSTVFLARGVDLDFDQALQASSRFATTTEQPHQTRLGKDGIALTRQMKDLLNADDKAEVQLLGASYQNRMNAVDATVRGEFTTGIEAIEDKGLKAPLSLLQSLYDTDSVSRTVIELTDRAATQQYREQLAAELERQKPGWFEVTSWDHPQIGQLYSSFMGFFKLIFLFTGAVVFLISLTTIQHTLAMNVADRVREIGMMRAMGYSRRSITGLFVRESVLTTVIAAVIALALTYVIIWLLGALGVQTQLPRIASPAPLALDLPLVWGLGLALAAVVGIALGSWLTARKRIGGAVRVSGKRVQLVQLLSGVACLMLMIGAPPAHAEELKAPSVDTMLSWLKHSDMARGGYGNYAWTLRIHTEDPAGTTDTTYAVAVKAGKALARTLEPKRYQGEKVLIAERSMWYIKPGLRKPVTVSPQQRLVGEAANGDIAAVQYAREYAPAWLGDAVIEGADCYKLKLTAAQAGATYDSIIYYVDKKTLLGVKAEFMTSESTIFKSAVFAYRNHVSADGKEMPFISSMKIVNASFPDRFSRLDYESVQKTNTPDSMFVLDTLMTM
jgi:putative ABC transport system permease protein